MFWLCSSRVCCTSLNILQTYTLRVPMPSSCHYPWQWHPHTAPRYFSSDLFFMCPEVPVLVFRECSGKVSRTASFNVQRKFHRCPQKESQYAIAVTEEARGLPKNHLPSTNAPKNHSILTIWKHSVESPELPILMFDGTFSKYCQT